MVGGAGRGAGPRLMDFNAVSVLGVTISAIAGLSITALHGDMLGPPSKEEMGDLAVDEMAAIGAEKAS